MFKRFLNNDDYLAILTEEHVGMLIRDKESRLAQAEEAAEESVREYLMDNYLVDEALAVGKNLLPYNRQITYPVGAHFYYEGKIVRAIRTINGYKAPASVEYWMPYNDFIANEDEVQDYTQRGNYLPGDLVSFAGTVYQCLEFNGLDYDNVRVPGVSAWELVASSLWEANVEYEVWDVVEYKGSFYALLTTEDADWSQDPHSSKNWGLIGSYDPSLNEYELSGTEYVVYEGRVYSPVINPNSDELKEQFNIIQADPRNSNLKKHILRLAVYELFKLISPNNISQSRITDYETSILWLRDASRLKINPQIPRRLGEDKKPVTDFAVATYMRDYDPYKNPWQV